MQILANFSQAFLSLVYPPLCLHCKQALLNPHPLLCSLCSDLLELLDPNERCSQCFSSEYNPKIKLCVHCLHELPFLDRIAAVFDYTGPAATLIKKFKYSDMPHLKKGIAAYMAAQFLQLDWPAPDLIVPVPITFPHLFERGFNQSALLAEELTAFIPGKACDILKRKSGDYSQAGLNRTQRLQLSGETFTCKTSEGLSDKVILLVDDVTTTGSTLRRCAEALQMHYPKSIYALVFCKAMR
jgi:competence protein ComFC